MNFYDEGKLLVGICGGAYALNSIESIMYIKKNICKNIKIIVTENSKKFVNINSLSYLINSEIIDDNDKSAAHISITKWSDLMLILPATANTISKASLAIADNNLLTAIISAKCPIIFYPGMNITMWENKLLQKNVLRLQKSGYYFSYKIDKEYTLYNKSVTDSVVYPDLKQIRVDIRRIL